MTVRCIHYIFFFQAEAGFGVAKVLEVQRLLLRSVLGRGKSKGAGQAVSSVPSQAAMAGEERSDPATRLASRQYFAGKDLCLLFIAFSILVIPIDTLSRRGDGMGAV